MTPTELKVWLGVDADAVVLPAIVAGMAVVPVPTTPEGEIEAFRAFLACAGRAKPPATTVALDPESGL